MVLRALLASLVATALGAQSAVLQTLQDQEALTLPPPATLMILEPGGKNTLSEGFRHLLEDPQLRVYQVPFKVYARGSGPLKEVATRYHLHLTDQWLLVRTDDERVLARGLVLPTVPVLSQALEQAGFRDQAKELKAYLKRNPESLEAREWLLNLLRQRGEAETQFLLGIQVSSLGEPSSFASPDAGVTKPADLKPLSALQDVEAWSAFTQALDEAFRSGQWREMSLSWTGDGKPLDAASPMLQALYLRWLPTVEAALGEEPESESLWHLWIWMSQALGGRPLQPLLDSLHPSPLTPPGQWPPEPVVHQLLATAQTQAQWRTLKTHFLARWEDEPHPLRDGSGKADASLLEQDWEACLGPLLQSCLKAGDLEEADALFQEAWDGSRWPSLRIRAADLAVRCGQGALRARWSNYQGGAR